MVEKRFAFDLELFVIARRLGYKRFLEAPIRLRHQFTSTVSWRSVYRSLLDTMAIWYRLRILHFYDGDQAPATPGGEGLLIDPIVLRGGAGTAAGSAGVPGRRLGGRLGWHGWCGRCSGRRRFGRRGWQCCGWWRRAGAVTLRYTPSGATQHVGRTSVTTFCMAVTDLATQRAHH